MLQTAGILETSGVSFTTFQFSRASFRWWEAYERHRSIGVVPLTWHEFSILFLEKFVSHPRREELRRQFEQLRQDERVSRVFDKVVDIARQNEMVHSQERVKRKAKRPRGSGDFSGVPLGGQFYRGRGHSYRPALTGHPAHHGASASHSSYSAHSGQSSFSSLPLQSSHHASSSQASTGNSSSYQEQQFRQRRGCFECREFGHYKRNCPKLLSGDP
ncbi:uncharacterized protein [Nicotiana tomentosiformis]|uniref:uncharacterized protein n=1 Tax=Nicotiana tomentosiformis TaxID=4098 RepID=UPI00388C52E9